MGIGNWFHLPEGFTNRLGSTVGSMSSMLQKSPVGQVGQAAGLGNTGIGRAFNSMPGWAKMSPLGMIGHSIFGSEPMKLSAEKIALWAQQGMSLAPHSSWHGAAGGGLGALAAHSPAYKPPIVQSTPGTPATAAGIQQTIQQQAAQHGPQAPKLANHESNGSVSTEPVKMPPIKPFRLQGEDAWKSLKKSDVWLSLSPFAQGFFSRCFDSNVSEAQVRAGIDKSAAFDPEIRNELQAGFEKLSGLGDMFGRALGRITGGAARGVATVRNINPATGIRFGATVPHAPPPPGGGLSGMSGAMGGGGMASPPVAGPAAQGMFGRAVQSAPARLLGRTALGAGLGAGAAGAGQAGYQGTVGDEFSGGAAPTMIGAGLGAAAGALSGRPGRLGGLAGRAMGAMRSPGGQVLGATGVGLGSAAATRGYMMNKFQDEVSGKMNNFAQTTGMSPQSAQAIFNDPAKGLAGLQPQEQQALLGFAQKHMPGAHPMHGLNEMLNQIPWLGQQQFWQTMHPGGKLMALAGLLGAGGGALSGNGMMAGAGGLAAVAPFIYHMMANNGGQPQGAPGAAPPAAGPPAGPQVPGVGPGAPAGAMEAEGGPPAQPMAPPARPAPQPGDWAGQGGPQQMQFLDQNGGQLPVPQAM